MHRDAIAWAESVTGSAIEECRELVGGMTSTMLALSDAVGGRFVLRLMTQEPWRSHGPALTRRERAAQLELARTPIPAPVSVGLDPDGAQAGVAAHLMSRLSGRPTVDICDAEVAAMAEMLAAIHDVEPSEPFRAYQSWAPDIKWTVPPWSGHPDSWQRAFAMLAEGAPGFDPCFLHRDFSHRNLLWRGTQISGVVDWVETSTGPAWLDAAHAATNLAVAFGPDAADQFLRAYGALAATDRDVYWLVMDVVGFLPFPGQMPMFGSAGELARLDGWLHRLVEGS